MNVHRTSEMISEFAWTLGLLLAVASFIWLLVHFPWVVAAWSIACAVVAPLVIDFIVAGGEGED